MSSESESAAVSTPPRGFARRNWWQLTLLAIIVVPAVVFALWTAAALHYSYSTGQRVGFVQKFSRKGWLCKTWEGELAMVNMPGSLSQIFDFSVRDDSVAQAIMAAQAKGRAELQYEEHRGVPTRCFGETTYFVTGVRSVGN
jgi:hypothetical protein